METTKIHKKLDELLENSKTKNFLNHLIRSYLPVSKTQKVFEKPKGKFRCVLTNTPLACVEECLDGIHTEEFKNDFLTHIKSFASEEPADTPVKKLLNGRVLGFTGEKTDTFMCQEAFQEFYNWVIAKMLKGDKTITWVLNSMTMETFITKAESLADDDQTKKVVKGIKKATNNGRATTNLGQLDVLQQLKAKMEAEEK